LIQSSIETNKKYNLGGRVFRLFVVANPLFGKRVGKSSANSPNVNGLVTANYLQNSTIQLAHMYVYHLNFHLFGIKRRRKKDRTN
jgi:hypothetical protein